MLAVRIVGDADGNSGEIPFCSLCGKPSADYFLTPWEHISMCEDCYLDLRVWCRVAERLGRQGVEVKANDFVGWDGMRVTHATSS